MGDARRSRNVSSFTRNEFGELLLMPGAAAGYIDGDFIVSPVTHSVSPVTLAYVQTFFPDANYFFRTEDTLNFFFGNPVGSGVTFGSSQTTIDGVVSLGNAQATFETTLVTGGSSFAGTVGDVISTVGSDYTPPTGLPMLEFVSTPEPATSVYSALAAGVLLAAKLAGLIRRV